jgi:hypothetical protein
MPLSLRFTLSELWAHGQKERAQSAWEVNKVGGGGDPCNRPSRSTGLWDVEGPRFLDKRLIDGGEAISLRRRPLLTPRMIPATHSCYWLSRPQDHSAAASIRSSEKSNDFVGNRARSFPTCSIVFQRTTLPRAAFFLRVELMSPSPNPVTEVDKFLTHSIGRRLEIPRLVQLAKKYSGFITMPRLVPQWEFFELVQFSLHFQRFILLISSPSTPLSHAPFLFLIFSYYNFYAFTSSSWVLKVPSVSLRLIWSHDIRKILCLKKKI